MRALRSIFLSVALLSPLAAVAAPVDGNIVWEGANSLSVAWNATPGKTYQLLSATDPAGPWQPVLPGPSTFTAITSFIAQSFAPDSPRKFFRVVQLDTDGPEIYRTEPANGGIAVSPQAGLQVWLRDENGLNTNSISLSITNGPPITWGDSRLAYTNGVLAYTPDTNDFLGAAGDTVTISLSAADTLGNQTANFTWSFQLQLPTVLSGQILFVGGAGGQTAAKAFGRVAAQTASGLTLISTNGDTFTYSYTGASSGLTSGQHLVNADLTTGYTRTVVSFTEYAASNTVVVVTRPTKLAELLQEGSLSSQGFAELTPQGTAKVAAPPAVGIELTYSNDLQQVVYQDGQMLLELLPGSYFSLNGRLDIGANFRSFKLREFEAKLSGAGDFRLEGHVNATASLDRSYSRGLITPVHKVHFVLVNFVLPVWVETVFEINAGYDLHLEGQADYTSGITAHKEIQVGRRWTETNGWTNIWDNPAPGFTILGPTWQVEGSGNLHLYLQPKVTAYVYSAAGISGDLQPYADLEGRLQLNPYEWGTSLYAGLNSTLALDLRVWDDSWGELPNVTFDLIPRTLLWHQANLPVPPQITTQPQSQTVSTGGTASFSVQAGGSGPLSYRWRKNGLYLSDDSRVSGTRSSLLWVVNAQASDAGDYTVMVSNPQGGATSQTARLSVLPVSVPSGLAFIPAGSFTMGDALDGLFSAPQHPVYVSAFYLDRTEVTKALWDEVCAWATTHGYSFDNTGSGQAANHPVQTVSWYDAVKWCNARSEKENRVPAYYTSAAQTTVYRTGQVNVQNDWVKWNSGYRLPTEAEWEKAARGGASGRRFPWADGDTITHSRANYYSYWSGGQPYYSYDANSTQGYHPTYNDGVYPYTSPAGSFAANGYGLYDMAGNVWEWCWDWYGGSYYSSSPGTDPRGLSSGSYRVLRGGGWYSYAYDCRTAYRSILRPGYGGGNPGFRSVLPPGQL